MDTKEQSYNATGIQRHRYLEVLHEFAMRQASLRLVDDICWNIAKTAIGELGFVDCVVYLVDETRSNLVQRAAHGDKNPEEREILDPIVIPVGEGIVGSVAATGKLEWVNDTRVDKRYILDDSFRCAELAVPILLEGEVIGVLDSEHPEAHFFSDEDVKLFTTIASLASTRIHTALALERLEQQAEELIQARRDAEIASEAKSRFLASISHDMRTPLTAILGYSKLLEEGSGSQEEISSWQRAIVANSEYMANMVGNVLDLTALESGQLHISSDRIEVKSWASDLESLVSQRAAKKGLAFSCVVDGDARSEIFTDRAKLTELVMNLLTNAVKYTFTGSIELRISGTHIEGAPGIELCVCDTGIGIAPDVQHRIFDPFTRVHDTERFPHIEGTGLGLSIVRQFVEALRGSISVESVGGKGTSITLVIPDLSEQPKDELASVSNASQGAEVQGQEVSESASLEGVSILFCEDSDTVATLVRLVLEREGATVTHAENGKKGIEIFSESGADFDLVITDIQMPVMDGFSVAEALRTAGWAKPIIALTAFATEHDADKCFVSGCSHYITKPIDVATFSARVASCLNEPAVQSV
ncbi:fused histidine kinase with GAF domain/response regulator receiver [gamma proteobacterium HIMB55]|nr:fused histidine kinase with GAF domain/response regulator receiver [gamma proteobacterium HIMB55]